SVNSYIIAIDLGTAFSGYPQVKRWGQEKGLDTPKAPTCLLFDEQQNFQSFGYKARDTYIRMKAEKAKKSYYFENFKMSLYGKVKDSSIAAVNGRTMKAMTVFTEALRFLKEDALKTISTNSNNCEFLPGDFTWVLTVPAIWDDSAKQFMREAATQAGIVSKGSEKKLVIALEPEAASIWCKKIPAEGFLSEDHSRTALQKTPGTQYIVVDCGGGTIDITVHEVLRGGALKELHKASGNAMGGQTVNGKFKEFLREIFCDGVWDEFEANHPGEVQKLMYDFTFMKQVDQEANFSCPHNLIKAAEKKKPIEKFFVQVKDVSFSDASVQISQEKMRSFFLESLSGITESLREILKKKIEIKYILLVGGYALSKVLRDHIKNQFGSQYEVLCPYLPQEAIMKGAVMFGKDRAVIASRKSGYTYGYSDCDRFDAAKHKEDKKLTNSEGDWCIDLFTKMVEVDQDVGFDKTKEYIFTPIESKQKTMEIRFFSTERHNLTYIDDWGAEQVGQILVEMPDTTGGLKRQVKLELIFGDTEITAKATDLLSNSEAMVTLDFISSKDVRDDEFSR
uniref:Heat shock 70 kDa protein 12A n=1 Tax=Neogobius melanostomus TaxID=47308 RepID=A0A8C6UN95_9GOBI